MKIILETFFLDFKSPKRRRGDLDKGREGSASVDDCAAEPLLLDPAPGEQDYEEQDGDEDSEDDDDGDSDDDYADDKEG